MGQLECECNKKFDKNAKVCKLVEGLQNSVSQRLGQMDCSGISHHKLNFSPTTALADTATALYYL